MPLPTIVMSHLPVSVTLHCFTARTLQPSAAARERISPRAAPGGDITEYKILDTGPSRGHVLAAALCIVAAKVGLVRADYLARYQVPGLPGG